MHYAGHIVQLAKVADSIRIVFVEIVLRSCRYVLEGDAHEIIALSGTLHVMEAQRVQEFVHDCAQPEAALTDGIQLQIDTLATVAKVADIWVATAAISLTV